MPVGALDVGSSAVKACLFDLSEGKPVDLDERSVDCPLQHPKPDWVEHDLPAVERAVERVLQVVPAGCDVSWVSAMHGLVLLDGKGQAISGAISWADGRASAQSEVLRKQDPQAHQRTGTPIHPMAWPAKLLWVQEQRPEWWKETRRVTDLKSYLWEALTGESAPLDRSSASGTGLWNNLEQAWDDKLLETLRLDDIAFPQVKSDHRLDWKGRRLYLGGADGPLGNLGVGAVGEGRIALSLGTSGAVRRYLKERRDADPALFVYALDQLGWVEGGAISNGGSVLDWLAHQEPLSPSAILQQASHAPAGARGLTVYPYFDGERAPFWRPNVHSQIMGRREEHDFADLARATLEGVAFCLRRLLDILGSSDEPVRCTGGMLSSPFFAQLLADVSGREIGLSPVSQATALGAALLVQSDALERSRQLPIGELVSPQSQDQHRYEDLYQTWRAGDSASRTGSSSD